MSPFVNFYHDLDFQCHMLQKFDEQTQCDHFGENCFDKNRFNGVGDIQRVYCFPGDQFSTWKMKTKLCDNLHSCSTLL